jgi:hypothetical protein
MIKRPLRPHFGPLDQVELLKSMGDARRRASLLAGAAGTSSPRYRLCQDLHEAIDALAADLTGDPSYFHDKPAPGSAQG